MAPSNFPRENSSSFSVHERQEPEQVKEAEAALRQREAKLEQIQRIGGFGSVEIDLQTMTAWRSPEYLQLHGLPAETTFETHAQWLSRVHREDREHAEQVLFDALSTVGANYISEYRIVRPMDGQIRWILARAEIERDETGQPLRLLGVHIDITRQKQLEDAYRQNEKRQAFLLKLTDALRRLSDASDVLYTAARVLGEHLGANRVGYAEDQGDGHTIAVTRNYTDGVSSIEGRYRYQDYGEELLSEFKAGRTVIRSDIANDTTLTAEEKAAHAVLQLGATLNRPLMKAGQLVAVLFVHYREAHQWTDEELALLDEVAERTWADVERARAETALRASEEKYRTLFNSIDEGFYLAEVIWDKAGNAVDIFYLDENPAAVRMIGQSAKGRLLSELDSNYEQYWRDIFGHTAKTGEAQRLEQYAAPNDIWFNFYVFKPEGIIDQSRIAVIFHNINERKRAEDAMRRSNQRITEILESITDIFYALDKDFVFTYLNNKAEEVWGKRREELLGKPFLEAFPQAAGSDSYGLHLKVMAERQPIHYETLSPILHRWIAVSLFPSAGGGISVYFHDIQDRKEAEAALRRAHDELETRVQERTQELSHALKLQRQSEAARAELVKRIVTTQEAERGRISRELHDNMGQHLTGVMLGLQALEMQIQSVTGGKRTQEIPQLGLLRAQVDELMRVAHNQARELRPAELDAMGLEAAIGQLVSDWSGRNLIAVDLQSFGWDERRPDGAIETTLYRVVQEALTNVTRHANATQVSIVLRLSEGMASVIVEDNGEGFKPEPEKDRLGMLAMQERLSMVGGTLDVESSLGEGTTIFARVPLQAPPFVVAPDGALPPDAER